MPYVSSSGTVVQERGWSLSVFTDFFKRVFSLISLFFATLFNPTMEIKREERSPLGPTSRVVRGGGGGGGGGSGGGGGGTPGGSSDGARRRPGANIHGLKPACNTGS